MNFNVSDTLKFITVLAHEVKAADYADVVVIPPFTSLYSAGVALSETPFFLGAQNMHWEDSGAFTGEISGSFLKDIGCKYVLIGHSERRHIFNESDELIAKKIDAAVNYNLSPILCVGENEKQRSDNLTWNVIEDQLKHDLANITPTHAGHLQIAYEPLWAIGTGKIATPDQAEEVHSQIRSYLSREFDGAVAEKTRILYGGSVKASNAKDILSQPNIDGVLVGGASLDPKQFGEIIYSAV